MYIKNGPPIKAIIIPAGSSYGAAIRRPMISHISTNEAPSKALVGRRYLASLPNKVLHI